MHSPWNEIVKNKMIPNLGTLLKIRVSQLILWDVIPDGVGNLENKQLLYINQNQNYPYEKDFSNNTGPLYIQSAKVDLPDLEPCKHRKQ